MRSFAVGVCLLLGCSTRPAEVAEPTRPVAPVVPGDSGERMTAHARAGGRPAEDVERDAERKPEAVMDFFGVEPGMRVVELMAGRGYYVHLLADRVGPTGVVWAHNSPFVLARFAEGPITERLEDPGLKHVQRLDTELDEPRLPPDLDAVLMILFYHDTYWQGVDRARMNASIFAALAPGGTFGIVDHHAEAGSGKRDVSSLHRVDAALVRREIEAAGFVFEAESDLLRHPEEDRTVNVFEMRGKTDRFVYRFRKPV